MVGEGNPAYPETVIASDPQYRQRNVKLWFEAGQRLGIVPGDAHVPAYAEGGTMGDADQARPMAWDPMAWDRVLPFSQAQPLGSAIDYRRLGEAVAEHLGPLLKGGAIAGLLRGSRLVTRLDRPADQARSAARARPSPSPPIVGLA